MESEPAPAFSWTVTDPLANSSADRSCSEIGLARPSATSRLCLDYGHPSRSDTIPDPSPAQVRKHPLVIVVAPCVPSIPRPSPICPPRRPFPFPPRRVHLTSWTSLAQISRAVRQLVLHMRHTPWRVPVAICDTFDDDLDGIGNMR